MILRSDTAPRERQFCENVPVALTETRCAASLRRALDEQKQLVDQLKKLANEKASLAERAGTARDSLVAMINDVINQVALDPDRSLSEAELTRKLVELSEKTKIEFDRVFVMIGD